MMTACRSGPKPDDDPCPLSPRERAGGGGAHQRQEERRGERGGVGEEEKSGPPGKEPARGEGTTAGEPAAAEDR